MNAPEARPAAPGRFVRSGGYARVRPARAGGGRHPRRRTEPEMKRAIVLALALLVTTGLPARAEVPSRVDSPDPKGDLVNPALGVQPPGPAAYGYSAVDIRGWSLHADGTTLRASITTEGRWRDWVEHAAWGTVPSMLVLFRSPRLVAGLCPNCETTRGDRYRVGLMFRTNPCPGAFPPETALVVWDAYAAQPLVLARNVPYVISTDQHTITLALPYDYSGYQIAAPGDDLTDVSAQTLTWTAQAVYIGTIYCLLVTVAEGTADWSPQAAWDPIRRVHGATGISVRA